MNALKDQYNSRGFDILAFPCNQFSYQEPGSGATEILNGKTLLNYTSSDNIIISYMIIM